ncbi:Protein of unknown function (DUF2911) [Gelidibacter algens]|jgi:hypothetical protein|uniref:DUF2911 family protein n=1 Tax=Gelidibacter algens TaxID=49280 RepID=A0A1A7QWI1_9FLAO|nr:DUF2911 domain-containing protein [Gelidibacter algens]OBX22877.1 dihydrolipoamide dehydrogenase [Gelidibacter algens]RAJ27629.1 Protein of unknown function (DUF2911) [Gelidibacter algens]
MKKIMLCLAVIGMTFSVNAQIQTPQPSPFSKMEQVVGLTDVTVEYSRPNMRGRTIFGDLIPYGEVWRLGANQNTKIMFSTDVTVDGKTLKAGTYALYAIPNEKSWEVIFYTDSNNWGTPEKWDESKVAAKVTAETYPLPMKIETFTMSFDDLSSGGATLGIMWSDVYVGVTFKVPSDKMVSASIDKIMKGPGAGDYYAAAVYYLQEDKDMKQAKEWIDKAMSMTPKPMFYQLRQQSLIYAKAGDKKGAIDIAKKSLAASEAAGNADYVKMNKDSLKEWGAM